MSNIEKYLLCIYDGRITVYLYSDKRFEMVKMGKTYTANEISSFWEWWKQSMGCDNIDICILSEDSVSADVKKNIPFQLLSFSYFSADVLSTFAEDILDSRVEILCSDGKGGFITINAHPLLTTGKRLYVCLPELMTTQTQQNEKTKYATKSLREKLASYEDVPSKDSFKYRQ